MAPAFSASVPVFQAQALEPTRRSSVSFRSLLEPSGSMSKPGTACRAGLATGRHSTGTPAPSPGLVLTLEGPSCCACPSPLLLSELGLREEHSKRHPTPLDGSQRSQSERLTGAPCCVVGETGSHAPVLALEVESGWGYGAAAAHIPWVRGDPAVGKTGA